MSKSIPILIILVILIVGAGVVVLTKGHGGGKSETVAPTSSGVSLLDTCVKPSVAYVYNSMDQKNMGEKFLDTFFRLAGNAGINMSGVGKCYVNATSIGVKLRVYPSLVILGNISGLEDVILKDYDNLQVIDYQLSMYIARMLKLRIHYTYAAEAIVVNGTTPYSSLPGTLTNNTDLYRMILSLISESNITSIRIVGSGEEPVKTVLKPTLIFKSKYNLTLGAPYMEWKDKDYYVIKDEYMPGVIRNILGAKGVETSVKPDILEIDGEMIPVIGSSNASLELYVFEDYHCPYCARFYADNYDVLMNYTGSGNLRLYLLDFIVHPSSLKLHALTKCLYRVTGNSTLYAELTLSIYEKYVEDQRHPPSYEYLAKLVGGLVGNDTLKKAEACVDNMSMKIMEYSEKYRYLGITGTPTLFLWSNVEEKGLMLTGYMTPVELEKLIKTMLQG